MSDRERSHRDLLDLIMRPGVVEIIIALHERDGSANLAELRAAGITQPAPAPKFSRTAAEIRCPPQVPGKPDDAALGDWGFAADDIGTLRATGVLG